MEKPNTYASPTPLPEVNPASPLYPKPLLSYDPIYTIRVASRQVLLFEFIVLLALLYGLRIAPTDSRYGDFAWASFGVVATMATKAGLQALAGLGSGGIKGALQGLVHGTPLPTPAPEPEPAPAPEPEPLQPPTPNPTPDKPPRPNKKDKRRGDPGKRKKVLGE